MKKTTINIVLAMLCLNFSSIAQQNQAIDVTTQGLQIGQKVPDVVLSNIHNYKTQTAKISDFKGKLLILDFWATWCSPCIAMMPKMEVLQKQFEGKVQFLPLTYQSAKDVLPFLEKQRKGQASILPEVTDDKELHQLFPHIYLPHYVWIDREGVVKAITGYEEVTAANIEKMLFSEAPLTQKQDMKIAYDKEKPFLINGNGGDGSNLIYHSVLTGYAEGIAGGLNISTDSIKGRKILCRNLTLASMFRLAYGGPSFEKVRTIRQVRDTIPFTVPGNDEVKEWSKQNTYCYELIVPPAQMDDALKIMQADLDRYFPAYQTKMEKRKMDCLVLVRTSTQDKLKSKGGKSATNFGQLGCSMQNFPLQRFVDRLRIIYMQKSKLPIINGTGYSDWVDMEIEANLSDVEQVNKALAAYDLRFVQQKHKIDMLIIKDRNSIN